MNKGSTHSSMPRSTAETLKQIQQKQGLSISIVSTDTSKSSYPLDSPVSKEMRPKQNVTLDKTPKLPSRSSVATESKATLSQVRSVPNTSTAETRASSGQSSLSPNQSTLQEIKMTAAMNKTGTPISTSTETRAFGSQSWSNPSPLLATETKAQGISNRAIQSSENKNQGGSGRLSQNSAVISESKAQTVKLFQTDNKSQGRISQASTHTETKSQVNVIKNQSQLSFEGKVTGGLSRNPLNSPPLEVKVMGNNQGRPIQNFSTPQHENKNVTSQRGLSKIVVEGKSYNIQTNVTPTRSADIKPPNQLRVSQTMKSTPVRPISKLVVEQPTGSLSSLNPFRASTTKVTTSSAEEKSMFKVTRTSHIVAENQTAGHSKVSQNFSMHSESKAVSQVVKISSASSDPSLKTPVTFDNIVDSTANPVITTMPSTRGSLLKRSPVSRTLNSTPVAKKKCTKRASPNTPEQSGKNQQTSDSVGFLKGLPCDVTVTPVGNNRQGNVTYEAIAIPSTSANSKKNVACSSNSYYFTAVVCPACGHISLTLNYCHSCEKIIPSNAQVYHLQRTPQAAVPSFVSTKIVTTSTIQKKIFCQLPEMMGTNQTIQFQQEKVMIGPSPVMQITPRAKGRGRTRRKFAEPEIYTLSSDEEEPVPFNPILEEATGNATHFYPVESEGSKSEHSSASEILQDENQDFDDQFPGVTDINEDMLNDEEDPDEEEMEFEDEGMENEEEEGEYLSEEEDEEENHPDEENDQEERGQGPTDYPLRCRSIRIGSYKIHPKPNTPFLPVTLQHDSISFQAPSLTEPNKYILITLRSPDVIKVYAHFGRCLPILYVFTTPTFGEIVRNGLHMSQNDCRVYFDPTSKDDKTQKLTFLIEALYDEQRHFLRHVFPGDKKCIEIDQKTANEILVKSTPNHNTSQILRIHANDSPQAPTSIENQLQQSIATPPQLSVTKVILPPQPVVKLLTYPPPPQTGGITVTNEDLLCLNEGEFLNDAIIDFYLKYVFYEKLSPYHREKTHIFSSYFYPRLTHKPERPRAGDDPTRTVQVRRHNQVKTWTRHVDIFSKDYIIIPVNQNVHWFLAIICYPGHVPEAPNVPVKPESKASKPVDNVTSTDEQEVSSKVVIKELSSNGEGDSPNQDDNSMTSSLNSPYEVEEPPDSDDPTVETPDSSTHPDGKQRKEMPCICIFDSLSGPNRWRIAATLREYLEMEWKMKKGTKKVFDRNTMAGFIMKCPQQTNYSDCGMYLLQFVESFFENPIPYFGNPMPDLTNWFSEVKISKKRQQLKDLILNIQKKQQTNVASSSARKSNQPENQSGVQSSPKTVQQPTDNR